METLTEELEDLSAVLLLSNSIDLSQLASENLFAAVTRGLLVIEPESIKEKHIDQSIKAGRTTVGFAGVAA